MSSVASVPPSTTPAGTDRVNARALDAMVGLIVAQVNALIGALGVLRTGRGRLGPASVALRCLSAECRQMLEEIAGMLARIRRVSANYDTRQVITVTPTTSDADGAVTFLKGQPRPTPNFAPVLPVDGDPGRTYELTVRLRSVAQRSLFVALPTPGYIDGLRLLQTTNPALTVGAGVGALDAAVFLNAGAA